MKGSDLLQNVIGDNEGFTLQQTLVSIGVHADGKSGNLAGLESRDPVLGEGGDRGGQARGESTSGQHGDVDVSVGVGHGWLYKKSGGGCNWRLKLCKMANADGTL